MPPKTITDALPGSGGPAESGSAERCAHPDVADGRCTVCGACTHDVILNGACYFCGETELTVTVKPVDRDPGLVPADRLRRVRS